MAIVRLNFYFKGNNSVTEVCDVDMAFLPKTGERFYFDDDRTIEDEIYGNRKLTGIWKVTSVDYYVFVESEDEDGNPIRKIQYSIDLHHPKLEEEKSNKWLKGYKKRMRPSKGRSLLFLFWLIKQNA